MTTGAQAVIEALERHGVEVIFGYPGGAVLALYQALKNSKIKHVLVRQEQGAVHAASGYARLSGKPGVVIATSGPGATNLVTGIAAANMDSVPIVLITGQVETRLIGTDAFQEVDITGITQPISKHNYLVKDANLLPDIMDEAFHIASTGRKGPVLVDIPKDIAAAPCRDRVSDQLDLPGYQPTIKGSPKQIKTALSLMKEAERPLIYCGGGVLSSGASALMHSLAEKWDAPIVSSMMGLGATASDDPYFVGMVGLHGHAVANRTMAESDLILAVGTRFDDRVVKNSNELKGAARIIHIDIDPAEIGKNMRSRVPIVGDIANVCGEIFAKLETMEHKAWRKQIDAWRREYAQEDNSSALTSPFVLDTLNELTSDDVVYTTDVGIHQMFAAQHVKIEAGPHFISCGGLGAMGYGLPAAVGAKLASPDRQVIAITGDGSFQMNFNELGTIAEQGLDIKILLFNNAVLGMVRQLQYFYNDKNYFGIDLPQLPDFGKLVGAYGFKAYRIEERKDVASTLKEALANRGCTLIECMIDREEMVFPMVLQNKTLSEMVLEPPK